MQVTSKRSAIVLKMMIALGVAATALTVGSAAASAATDQVSAAPHASTVTEYYHGRAFHNFSPTQWNGASNCAVDNPTTVHCFDSSAQMARYTDAQSASIRANSPNAPLVSCSGWTKIWDGPNWTNRGLAFSDWGYAMNLNSYVAVPFDVRSWFSDGQRGYNSNNCDARIFAGSNATGSNILLPKYAHSISINFNSYSIELYHP